MIIKEIEFTVKDGRRAVLRNPREEDRIAGMCQISFETRIKTRHRASVAIALLKEYWNLGIGTRIFKELTAIAESNPDILQMELAFIEGNERAEHLYEKAGFHITGVNPEGSIGMLYVFPEYRHRGFGAALQHILRSVCPGRWKKVIYYLVRWKKRILQGGLHEGIDH